MTLVHSNYSYNTIDQQLNNLIHVYDAFLR